MRLHYAGELEVTAPPEAVWRLLTSPERVGRCLPDLEELAVEDARRFAATVRAGVGPFRGPFRLQVELVEEVPGQALGLRIRGSGMGSGLELTSSVHVEPSGDGGARLRWTAEGGVAGPLATLGGRVLDAQARSTIERLFANVRQALAADEAAAGAG